MNMRYIKTYESFYHEDDMAREIAMILDPAIVESIDFDPTYKDTSMFRGYSIDGDVDSDALESLKTYMEGEHGLITTLQNDKIFLTEKPLKETYIDWLNKNYLGLEIADSKDYPRYSIYRYEPKDNIFMHDTRNKVVWMRYDLVWKFFDDYFGLRQYEITSILQDWLSKEYDLNGITMVKSEDPTTIRNIKFSE